MAGKPRLILPYALDTNDFKFAMNPGWMSGDDFFAYLRSSFDQLYREGRAVQRCRFAVTESALQHLMVEMWRLIARGIPEPAVV